MTTIKDESLFVLQNGDSKYKYTGSELKADIAEVAAGVPGPDTGDNLWVEVGGNAVRTKDPNTGINLTGSGIFGGTVQGTFLNATSSVKGPYFECSGGAQFAKNNTSEGKNGAFIIGADGVTEHRAWIKTRGLYVAPTGSSEVGYDSNTNGGIRCQQVYMQTNLGGSYRTMRVNSDGYIGCEGTTSRSAATNIQPIDTSNFIAALKAVNLHRSDQTVDASSSYDGSTSFTDVGLFIEDVQATTASSFLVSSDDEGGFISDKTYSHFLFGVCKEQQALIENLTTRIEQLEADHASAMNNMEDDNGSSTY